jgi:hypothetical protein
MRAWFDIPIFDSPVTAWGSAQGEIEVLQVPVAREFYSIPHGSAGLTELGLPDPMLVWSVYEFNGVVQVLMDGVVAADRSAAATIGRILEQELGFDVTEYDWESRRSPPA